ncbi:MAG: hypothetical protein S4CHLAM7_09560 [Chlamydiae bacterium]|nr:hypothetical protein [Chlamydiota bacterium]
MNVSTALNAAFTVVRAIDTATQAVKNNPLKTAAFVTAVVIGGSALAYNAEAVTLVAQQGLAALTQHGEQAFAAVKSTGLTQYGEQAFAAVKSKGLDTVNELGLRPTLENLGLLNPEVVNNVWNLFGLI